MYMLQFFVRSQVCVLGLLFFILAQAAQSAEPERLLSDLKWKARVLLLFSPDVSDPRATAFVDSIHREACAATQRDIVLGRIVQGNESHIGEELVAPDEASQLRDRFGIGPMDFRILLIGKDGGVKATYTSVPELTAVFGLIDGMPMRRREAQEQSTACQ